MKKAGILEITVGYEEFVDFKFTEFIWAFLRFLEKPKTINGFWSQGFFAFWSYA